MARNVLQIVVDVLLNNQVTYSQLQALVKAENPAITSAMIRNTVSELMRRELVIREMDTVHNLWRYSSSARLTRGIAK